MNGLVPRLPPVTKSERKLFTDTVKIRGMTCEFCGKDKCAPIAGKGKLRERHNCSHGVPCERGKSETFAVGSRWRGNGTHANWPTCPQCLESYKASLDAKRR